MAIPYAETRAEAEGPRDEFVRSRRRTDPKVVESPVAPARLRTDA